jgi:hypothetical protein
MNEFEKSLAYVKSLGYNDAEAVKILEEKGIFDTRVTGKNVARSAIQGATFNFGDELAGLLPEWIQKEYTGTPEEIRAKEKAFSGAHPVVSGLANAAGGFVLPGGAAGGALKGAKSIAGTIARGAALGGAAGGLAGVGASEGGLAERAEGAVKPALAGAAIGGVLPGVPGAVRAALSPAKRAAGRLQGAIDRSGGVDALLRRLQDFRGAGRSAEVSLADLSRPLQQAADFSANNSDEAAEAFERVVRPRQENATGRILDDVRAQAGNPQADELVAGLEQSRQSWADGPNGYGGLRQQNPVVVPAMAQEFNDLMQTPAVQQAWQQAREVGLIGPMPKSGSVSFDVMQGTLERLNTAKESAFNRGAHDLAFRLKGAQETLEQQMTKAVPGFDRVHTEYGVRKSLERAVRRGEQILDEEDTRGLANELSTMTTQQVDQLRQGLASKLISRLRSAQTNRNEAQRLLNRSASMEEKLQLVFGGRHGFEEFMQHAELEAEMAKLQKVLGGSQTHRRGAASVSDAAEIAVNAATGHPLQAAVGAVRKAFPKSIAKRTARDMAPDLTTQGSAAIERLLSQWGQRPNLLPFWASKMGPVGAGVGAASLFGD